MSKIVELRTENVMRLKAVTIRPDGSLVIIGGANAQGKTSTLRAIAMALGGKDEVPAVPIRRGAEKGSIIIDLGDIVVRRTFTASGSALVIEDKEKKRFPTPQALLDGLTGRLTFDPLSFLTQKPKEQLDSLKQLVGLDFTADDEERAAAYLERTAVNREVERAQLSLSQAQHYPEVTAAADVTALNAELQEAQKHNTKLSELQASKRLADGAVAQANLQVKQADESHRDLIAQIEALNKKLKDQEEYSLRCQEAAQKLKAKAAEAQTALEAFEPRDIAAVQEKIVAAHEQNRKLATNTARATLAKTLADKKAEADKLTKAIEAIDERKQKKLAAAKFPVKGLSFGAGEVMFNDLPFTQASDAERMRVSVGMAAAMNPKLRVALVRNGSLLDKDNLALLEKLAQEHDLQVWIERVGTADPSAIIIEDGMVKGAPVEEKAKLSSTTEAFVKSNKETEQLPDLIP